MVWNTDLELQHFERNGIQLVRRFAPCSDMYRPPVIGVVLWLVTSFVVHEATDSTRVTDDKINY